MPTPPKTERRKAEPALTISQFETLLAKHDGHRDRECFGMPCEEHADFHRRVSTLMPYLECSKKAADAKAIFWNTLYDIFGLEKMQTRRTLWMGTVLCVLALFIGWHRALSLLSRWFG